MKTTSSSGYDNVLSSSNGEVVTCLPSNIDDNHQGHNIILDCRPQCVKQETGKLIFCNSKLASSLEKGKLTSAKVSPGHYLQKVFFNNSSAHKFRSQSLPNCVDDNKYSELLCNEDCCSKTIDRNDVSDVTSLCLENDPIDASVISNNEKWFKTWPERGFDKRHVKQDGFCSPNVSDDVNCYKFIEENGTDKDQINSTCNGRLSLSVNNTPVHINRALESIPRLGYSPLTKQLHVIDSNSSEVESQNGHVNNSGSEDNQITNDTLVSKDCNLSKCNPEIDVSSTVRNIGLSRVATEASCCSFSSTVSSLSDVSPSTNEDSALGSLHTLDHGDNCSLASIGECSLLSEDSVVSGVISPNGSKQKKKSISGFFSRNVFGWKSLRGGTAVSSEQQHRPEIIPGNSSNGISWKIFNRNNAMVDNLTTTTSCSGHSGYESSNGNTVPSSPCSVRSSGSVSYSGTGTRVRSHENIIASSSALIQLDRPACLPAKSRLESEKHRQQYLDMVDAAKKKEMKEAKHRQRQLQIQLKIEDQQSQAARTWSQEILPKWDSMCTNRKTRDLWWLGIPPCVRGKIWRLAIHNELNLTEQLYDICCVRAREMLNTFEITGDECTDNKEASVQLIQLDISRTFPNLCIFQQGGPYYDMLHSLLGAYVCYRPDVGYVQGMSFIAAVLILNMDVSDAFICFANLLNRPCHMAFFSLNQSLMQAYYATYNDFFSENLPHVYKHFVDSNLTPDLYLLDWIYTVFTKAMNLDLASRVWDVFLRDGEQFLFRTALGVLHMCQNSLLEMDFIHGAQYLTRLPDDLPADELFKSIASIKMVFGKQSFEQTLTFHLQQLQNKTVNCE